MMCRVTFIACGVPSFYDLDLVCEVCRFDICRLAPVVTFLLLSLYYLYEEENIYKLAKNLLSDPAVVLLVRENIIRKKKNHVRLVYLC